jgi:hypothetical protein
MPWIDIPPLQSGRLALLWEVLRLWSDRPGPSVQQLQPPADSGYEHNLSRQVLPTGPTGPIAGNGASAKPQALDPPPQGLDLPPHEPDHPPQEPDHPPPEETVGGLPWKAYVMFAVSCFSVAGAAYAIAPNVSLRQLAQDSATTGTTFTCICLLAQACYWLIKGYLRDESFRAKVTPFSIVRLGLLAAIATVGYRVSAWVVIPLGSIVIMGFLTLCSVKFERNVKKKIRKLRAANAGGREADTNKWIKMERMARRVRDSIELPFGEATRRELQQSPHVKRFRARASIAAALALTIVVCGFGTAAAILVSVTTNEPKSKQTRSRTTTTIQSHTTPAPFKPPANTTPDPASATQTQPPRWDGKCPPPPPQPEATPQANRALTALYGKGLTIVSPLEKGCIGHIYRHAFHGETYFSVAGLDPENRAPLSYSLDSERFGTVLVLASASRAIESLVSLVGPVGGVGRFPYYQVGSNEMADNGATYYLIKTRDGLDALVRRRATEAFLLLKPTVVRAWVGDMNEQKVWLWPLLEANGSSGKETFLLRSGDEDERYEATVTLDINSGTATRSIYEYRVHKKGKKEIEPSLSEIVQLAAKG